MSLQDFLDSRKEKPSVGQTVVDIFSGNTDENVDPIKSLSSWGSSLFDNVQTQVTDGISKVQQQSKRAGKVVGVVNEEGDLSVPLLGTKDQDEDPVLKLLSKKQRILGFILCVLSGMFCFSFAAALLPVLVISSRKFALLFTLGSLFFIISFSLLKGPVAHFKQLASKEKLPFTAAYFGSLVLTLYTAMGLQSQILTIFSSGAQLAALMYFFMSYIPGGVTGLTYMCKTMGNICLRLFPI